MITHTHTRSVSAQHAMTIAVCTAWHRAPELFAHSGGIDTLERNYDDDGGTQSCTYGPQVEVWAFGSLVYELLTGKLVARVEKRDRRGGLLDRRSGSAVRRH